MNAFAMIRDGKTVATVQDMGEDGCIVRWPTSTIVYGSIEDARAVHITHMGGRGAVTYFVPIMMAPPSAEEVRAARVLLEAKRTAAGLPNPWHLAADAIGQTPSSQRKEIPGLSVTQLSEGEFRRLAAAQRGDFMAMRVTDGDDGRPVFAAATDAGEIYDSYRLMNEPEFWRWCSMQAPIEPERFQWSHAGEVTAAS